MMFAEWIKQGSKVTVSLKNLSGSDRVLFAYAGVATAGNSASPSRHVEATVVDPGSLAEFVIDVPSRKFFAGIDVIVEGGKRLEAQVKLPSGELQDVHTDARFGLGIY